MSDKFEYFAVRNAAGRVRLLAAVQVPDPRARTPSGSWPASSPATSARAPPGNAQYTAWCDDRGFVVEDGVILRHGAGRVPADRRRTEPRLLRGPRSGAARRRDRGGQRRVSASWPSRARDRATCSPRSSRRSPTLPFFGLADGKIARLAGDGVADRLQRRPRLRDLGPRATTRSRSGTRCGGGRAGYGVLPFGLDALDMLRIEAGLLLLDVDFASSRFGWTDEDRSTPIELGWAGWSATSPSDDRRVHRPPRDRARARRQDVALAADRPDRRLARLRPDLQRGRADPAQGPHPGPRRDVRVRRRQQPGRLHDQLHVLADAAAPHRPRPRPAGARRRRARRSTWRST